MVLVVFFTRSVSLEDWVELGLFEREKLVYEKFLENGVASKVYWITYGTNDINISIKLKHIGRLHKKIFIQQMPKIFNFSKLGVWVYSFFSVFICRSVISKADIFKTNQLDGGWSALMAKLLYKKPVIARCGYIPSKLLTEVGSYSKVKLFFINIYERYVLLYSDICVVSSEKDKLYVNNKYLVSDIKIKVVNNYVDTDHFRRLDHGNSKNSKRLIFVGRVSYQKNLPNLLYAIKDLNLGLDIVGEGDLSKKIYTLSKNISADVRFLGRVNNEKLPLILNNYTYFVLPSLSEGTPKVLLEAMSCELVCIGTPVSGITEIIKNGENGYISNGTDIKSIKNTIKVAISSTNDRLRKSARRTIVSEFSLNNYVEKEGAIIKLANNEKLHS